MTYRAAVIGCGRIGCGFDDDPTRRFVSTHAGAYRRTPGIDLVALSDLDVSRLTVYGDKFDVPGRYLDFKTMLATENLDLLSVCTWNSTHQEIVTRAAEAGVRAILCEKPIAESLAAADAIIESCARRGVVLLIDHMRRFDPFQQEIAAFLRENRLGAIQQVTCYYTAGLANTGTHLLDLLRFYFGDVEWVEGRLSDATSPNPFDPNVDGWLRFATGFSAVLQACDVKSYLIFEINILGTYGRLRVTDSGFNLHVEEVRQSNRFDGYRELSETSSPIAINRPHEFMLHAVQHLIDCLERRAQPLSSGEDGRKALELICALRESAAKDGSRIALPLESTNVTISSR